LKEPVEAKALKIIHYDINRTSIDKGFKPLRIKLHCISSKVPTSASRQSPSSWEMYNIRLLMISSDNGLNLNFAHLEASGSIIL